MIKYAFVVAALALALAAESAQAGSKPGIGSGGKHSDQPNEDQCVRLDGGFLVEKGERAKCTVNRLQLAENRGRPTVSTTGGRSGR